MVSKNTRTNRSRFKAMIAFLPYAVRREENGVGEPLKALLHTARFSQPPLPFSNWPLKFWKQCFLIH